MRSKLVLLSLAHVHAKSCFSQSIEFFCKSVSWKLFLYHVLIVFRFACERRVKIWQRIGFSVVFDSVSIFLFEEKLVRFSLKRKLNSCFSLMRGCVTKTSSLICLWVFLFQGLSFWFSLSDEIDIVWDKNTKGRQLGCEIWEIDTFVVDILKLFEDASFDNVCVVLAWLFEKNAAKEILLVPQVFLRKESFLAL